MLTPRKTAPRVDRKLSPSDRADAHAALALLEGTGISLESAARLALGKTRPVSAMPLGAAVDLYLREHRTEWRPATATYFAGRLQSWVAVLGSDRGTDTITVEEVESFCRRDSAGGTAARWRAVRAWLRWAYRRRPPLLGSDLAAEVRLPSGSARATVDFLTVPQCAAILQSARPYHLPAIALALFAGVRPYEIADEAAGRRLLWRHVDPVARIIRIPAELAKTGQARIIEKPFIALWIWLVRPPGAGPDDPICPHEWAHVQRGCARTLQAVGASWSHDVLRHTFATYHVAAYGDPGATSMVLGHEGNPSTLHRHYRGLVTQVEGMRFAGLQP